MKAQGQRVDVAKGRERHLAHRPLADLGEDGIAQFVEALRHHPGGAIGEDRRDRHGDRGGMRCGGSSKGVDGPLVEQRDRDVDELAARRAAPAPARRGTAARAHSSATDRARALSARAAPHRAAHPVRAGRGSTTARPYGVRAGSSLGRPQGRLRARRPAGRVGSYGARHAPSDQERAADQRRSPQKRAAAAEARHTAIPR